MYVRIEFGQPKARYFAKYQQEDANVNGRNGLSYACFFAFVAVTLSLMKEERNESEVRSSGHVARLNFALNVKLRLNLS
ncbi:hypothetical protein CVT25_010547 [Psilocybe cyanescens]|uniref:Uncharacterized protein n=1 Tax=Psilocybe cyanescens TaxID=93625 RepID=A0A409WJE6_PSICY|nr:hypothetical protein CVT25_010547 [Psilocybe cyanescens]